MSIPLIETAKRVKRGARLLDKKVPNWRTTMRRYAKTFDINDTNCCILGTLEHHNGRMRVLKARKSLQAKVARMKADYYRGVKRLDLDGKEQDYGFNFSCHYEPGSFDSSTDEDTVNTLWRAEFEK